MYKSIELPKYPAVSDVWDYLASQSAPVVVYGMGNGADKLIERFSKYGIEIADFFASDGFVRGHSFHGKRVKSFSEIKAEYESFVIVLSFASNRAEVIDMLREMNENYDMVIPDMPVASSEYFDKDFYNAHYGEILSAYNSLCDEASKSAFANAVHYKLSGRMRYLLDSYSDTEEIYSLLPKSISVAVDCGAYNGDTVREILAEFPAISRVYAIEPDGRNYRKLEKYINEERLAERVVAKRAAVWCENSEGGFTGSGNRNSSVNSTVSYKNREESVELIRLDSYIKEKVDYIKYDVEGAEAEALLGTAGLVEKYSPALLISVYHKSEDLFSILNVLAEKYVGYRFYMRRTLCVPAWELAVIAVPNGDAPAKA